MRRIILLALAVLATVSAAHAKARIYGVKGGGIEGDGYRFFVSDKILDTVPRPDGKGSVAAYCASVDGDTSKTIGEISAIRSDSRLPAVSDQKMSYATACLTYNSVVDRLKSAEEVRKLWLLFADSATDDFVVDTLKHSDPGEDSELLIEIKRLAMVSKYVEFFTKNKEWRLTDYTFLSQAFKARKGKALSPAFGQFVGYLLTGDAEKALSVVQSIDLNNLGSRFTAQGTGGAAMPQGSGSGAATPAGKPQSATVENK